MLTTSPRVFPVLLAVLGVTGCSSPPAATSSTKAGVAAIVPAVTRPPVTRLPASLHPFALPERDRGRVDASRVLESVSLVFQRSPDQARRLKHDLVDIQDPTSPRYHAWISPTEFGARYGASPADIARASAWLTSQGLLVKGSSPTANRLSFTGTVGQIEHAFQTELHHYEVNGVRHFAPSRAPAVPLELGSLVAALHGVNDFRPPPPSRSGTRQPRATYQGEPALGPADFAAIYDVSPLYAANITGKGQSIAIVGESFYNPDDVLAFRTSFGLDTSNLPTDVLVPDSGSSQVIDPGDVSESELDMEWSGGIAKDAKIFFVYTGNSPASYGFFDAMVYAVESRTAPIVSVSYGTCEKGLTPGDAIYYGEVGDLAAMVGVTVLVASGDTGAAGCDAQSESAGTQGLFVGFPASIPTVTSVGGTQFTFTSANQSTYWSAQDSALQYIPEQAWNQTFVAHAQGLGASGGGYSVVFPRPYWQAAALPSSMFRGLPDISLSASSDQVPYLISESWTAAEGGGQTPFAETLVGIGGTSASTPSFAGILALLNQSIHATTPGLGNIGPELYALNASVPAAFHDIMQGSNAVPCESGTTDCPAGTTTYGYSATRGYDLATGLGSLDVAKFVTAWTALAPTSTTLSVNGSGGTEPTTLTLTATVGSSATTKPLTGTVTFYFETLDSQSHPALSYVLAEVPVTADVADGGGEGATVTTTAPAPVGLTGASQIVAFYGGDQDYLASYSTAASVMTTSTLTVSPTTITLQPNQQTVFTATGGAPPVTWHILSDNACDPSGQKCSETKSDTPTTGGFQAGPGGGTVVLEALDSDFAEARVTISVAGSPVDGGMLIPVDSGVDAGKDSGPRLPDAGSRDASRDDALADAGRYVGKTTDGSARSGDAMTGHGDSGARHAGDAAKDDAGEPSGSPGGCHVGAREEAPDASLLGLFGLGLILGVKRRRPRACATAMA